MIDYHHHHHHPAGSGQNFIDPRIQGVGARKLLVSKFGSPPPARGSALFSVNELLRGEIIYALAS